MLGNELAIAASLKQANMVNVLGVPTPPAKASTDPKDKDKPEPMPIVADRHKGSRCGAAIDAARFLTDLG